MKFMDGMAHTRYNCGEKNEEGVVSICVRERRIGADGALANMASTRKFETAFTVSDSAAGWIRKKRYVMVL